MKAKIYSDDYAELFKQVRNGQARFGKIFTPKDKVVINVDDMDVYIESATKQTCYSHTYHDRPNHEADFIQDCKKLNLRWVVDAATT